MKLLKPTELGKLINKQEPQNKWEIIEYIDKLHNQLLDYQLVIDTIMNTAVANNKDVSYSKDK